MDQEYYIKKWLSGTLTEQEQQDFEQTDTYRELQELDHAIQSFKAPELDVEKTLKDLSLKPEGKVIKVKWWKPVLRAAAAVLIGVLVFQYYPLIMEKVNPSMEMIRALNGETVEWDLPGASQVTLNASSTIRYRADKWEQHRVLDLDGEAYFKVTPGATFRVETTQGSVTVRGTEFNVKSRPSYFEVVCYEGSVQVQAEQYREILRGSQMFRIVNGTHIKNRDLDIQEPTWINQVSSFISVPYGEVVEEFKRQYDVQIELQDIDLEQLFTGSFTHKDLELALASITQPLNIGYNIRENQTISLSGEVN